MQTEKEKMLAGLYYLSGDKELVKERKNARSLLKYLNDSSDDEDYVAREGFIRQLLGAAGCSPYIEPPFYCDYGYNIRVGANFYANFNCTILDVCQVTMGDNVMLGPHVQIYTATHPLTHSQRINGIEYGKPVSIGNNVWIGGGSIINPGVSIGNNVVIGSGSVVTKDIPDNVLVAGNPARVIRELP